MHYIDLKEIDEQHLCGNWEVVNRDGNVLVGTDLFAGIRVLDMQRENYRSINGRERVGKWSVLRESTIIYNPQLKFYLEEREVANAIITRLRIDSNKDGAVHKLTLYFDTGLELVLCKRTT